jgi:hypothetical protein
MWSPLESNMADILSTAQEWILYYAHNFYHNITHMLDGMNAKRWIRLIAIVGAYFLLRPYLLKFGAKVQAAEHEKSIHGAEELDKKAAEKEERKAKLAAGNIRGEVVEVRDSEEDDSEEEGEATANDVKWGKKARKRSRKVIREILEEQERLLEEDDNEDIKEFLESDVLVDFKEGEDGW